MTCRSDSARFSNCSNPNSERHTDDCAMQSWVAWMAIQPIAPRHIPGSARVGGGTSWQDARLPEGQGHRLVDLSSASMPGTHVHVVTPHTKGHTTEVSQVTTKVQGLP